MKLRTLITAVVALLLSVAAGAMASGPMRMWYAKASAGGAAPSSPGNAIAFINGSSQKGTFATVTLGTNYTVSAWVCASAGIVAVLKDNVYNAYLIGYGSEATMYCKFGGSSSETKSWASQWQVGVTSHFVLVRSGQNAILYKNGANKGANTLTTPNNDVVGTCGMLQTFYGSMTIDELSVWTNRALTQSEITGLYNSSNGVKGVVGTEPYTAGFAFGFHFDETTGATNCVAFGSAVTNMALENAPQFVPGKVPL